MSRTDCVRFKKFKPFKSFKPSDNLGSFEQLVPSRRILI